MSELLLSDLTFFEPLLTAVTSFFERTVGFLAGSSLELLSSLSLLLQLAGGLFEPATGFLEGS